METAKSGAFSNIDGDGVLDTGVIDSWDGAIDRFVKYLCLGKNVGDLRHHPDLPWHLGKDWYSDYSKFLNLEQIDVSPDNEMYYSIDGVLYEKSTHKLCIYPTNKRNAIYVVPDDVTGVHYSGTLNGKNLQIVEYSSKVDSLYLYELHKNLRKLILPASLKYVKLMCKDSLKSVYVKSSTPCEMELNPNYGTVRRVEEGDVVLYVPRGSAGAYRNHSEWGRFKLILEYDTIDYSVDYTAVIEPKAEEAKVVVAGNNVSITTADSHSVAYIYDICGRLVASGRERTFSINQKGVFILRFSNLTKKFFIR